MDWHAWLSAAPLEPALVYEYALVLARNELDAGDIAYFDHEFLHSMGISVAKHRLEILKLVLPASGGGGRCRGRLSSSSPPATSLSRLRDAVDSVARRVRSLVHRRRESTALVLVPSQQQPVDVVVVDRGSSSWNYKAPKRTRTKPKGTAGAAAARKATRPQGVSCRGAATVHAIKDVENGAGAGEEMVRWDRLFQDLNPN